MEVPAEVAAALDGTDVVETVDLGGEDTVYVTPTFTLLYRGDGLLSDAGVERVPHEDVTRVSVDIGRRRASIEISYGVGADRSLSVPQSSLSAVLTPLLAGILREIGVLSPRETVEAMYRSSELTLVITSEHLLKHVGPPVWDQDHEAIAWANVTSLDLEEGTVATQLVVDTTDRSQRTKLPTDRGVEIYRAVESALCAYHGVEDYAAFRDRMEERGEPTEQRADPADLLTDAGLDPLGAGEPNRAAEAGMETEDSEPPAETAGPGLSDRELETLAAHIEDLESSLERQADLIESQREALADLKETLTRDR